jgi:hypothetical protein
MNARFKSCAMVALTASSLLWGTTTAFSQGIEVLRVDIQNGSPGGSGEAWELDAFRFLQDALVRADELLAAPIDPPDTVQI